MSIQSLYASGYKGWQDINIDNLTITDLTVDTVTATDVTSTNLDVTDLTSSTIETVSLVPPITEPNLLIARPIAFNFTDQFVEADFEINNINASIVYWSNVVATNPGYGGEYLPVLSGNYMDFSACSEGIFLLDVQVVNSNSYNPSSSPITMLIGAYDQLDTSLGANEITRTGTGAVAIGATRASFSMILRNEPGGMSSFRLVSNTNQFLTTALSWSGHCRIYRLA